MAAERDQTKLHPALPQPPHPETAVQGDPDPPRFETLPATCRRVAPTPSANPDARPGLVAASVCTLRKPIPAVLVARPTPPLSL